MIESHDFLKSRNGYHSILPTLELTITSAVAYCSIFTVIFIQP